MFSWFLAIHMGLFPADAQLEAAFAINKNAVLVFYSHPSGCRLVRVVDDARPKIIHDFSEACFTSGLREDQSGRLLAWNQDEAVLLAEQGFRPQWQRVFGSQEGIRAAVATSAGLLAVAQSGALELHWPNGVEKPRETKPDPRIEVWVGVVKDAVVGLGHSKLFVREVNAFIPVRRLPRNATEILSNYSVVPDLGGVLIQPCDIVGRLGSRCLEPYLVDIFSDRPPVTILSGDKRLTRVVGTTAVFAKPQGGALLVIDLKSPDRTYCLGSLPPAARYVYASSPKELIAVSREGVQRVPVPVELDTLPQSCP
ncbi:MAG: hypothetical protein AAF654_09345 [Myxococcota bacterium]